LKQPQIKKHIHAKSFEGLTGRSLYNYTSNVVKIGELPVGGHHPVRVQSMTTTPTMDTEETVAQSIRLIEAGCELVRITAQNSLEAENLHAVKEELHKKGYKVPLIADIHYKPEAAEVSARIVEKVRINPGNYVDRKRGRITFSDDDYAGELERIRERIKPLIVICKEHGTALRIGANHGSLSERILYRYGDTPQGMVKSAMEFIDICEDLGFRQMILSMKASNVKVMVQANRLLVKRMIETGRAYPIHLGVTEAGDGEDGRIKSAAGIGSLLLDGIGDTIRVSLTEDPENEIPVAKILAEKYQQRTGLQKQNKINMDGGGFFDPFVYNRRVSREIGNIGGNRPPVVILTGNHEDHNKIHFPKDRIPDFFAKPNDPTFFSIGSGRPVKPLVIKSIKELQSLDHNRPQILVFDICREQPLHEIRDWFRLLSLNRNENPVILKKNYGNLVLPELIISSATEFGFFLVDGLGDGIWIESEIATPEDLASLSFGILQATGSRITKTEFIACPSCGRTLFRLQDTLQKIKKRTSHLKGLKIGVMGCCVNGPGEMADAHYGYVGAGKGKVTLYKGKKIMKTAIPEDEALDELVRLIRENGDWMD
jgi:(E)-4-hydroxy-3-methylbut-2-enyl-diphosphate synthase